jgi:hypothetical protein
MAVAAAGIALAAAAVASVFVTPDRWQAIFYVQSSGSNEVHLPIGYWIGAALWMLAVATALRVPVATIAPRAVLTAAVTHLLVLLAEFSGTLQQADLFSARVYHAYARLFCAAVLAVGAAWSFARLQRMQMPDAILGMPIIVATGILAVALLRVEPSLALAGLGAGAAAAWATASSVTRASLSGAWQKAGAAIARDRVFLVLLFLVALVMRLLYLQRVMSNPGYLETGADGPVYDELAWSIAQGRGVRQTFIDRFPLLLLGYVWLVSGIYRLAGHSYLAVGVFQAIIGSITCLVFYRVASHLCGVTIARVAAVFTAISFPLLFASAAIGHQAIDVFLTTVIVWVLVTGGSPATWSWWRWAAVGVLFGLAITVRETVAFFLAFVALWILFQFPRPWSWRGPAAAATVLAAAFLTIAPLLLPKVSSVEERDKLRHHFDVLYRGEFDPIRMRDDIVAPLSNPGAAFNQLRESPGFVLGTLGRAWTSNFATQFFAQPYGGFDLVFLRKGTPYFYLLWFYVYALTVAGLALVIRRLPGDAQQAGLVLVIGLIASRTVPHIILESNYRHRVPIEPFLILLASVGAVSLIRASKRAWAPAA